MKIRTLIIDDEPIALEKLRTYVEKVGFLELVGQCSSGLEAMEFMSATPVDVIFSDINMPDLSGLELVSSLPAAPLLVFTTAYAQYALDGFRLSAVDYLLKPYSFSDFNRAANKVCELYNARNAGKLPVDGGLTATRSNEDTQGGTMFVKVDYRYVRVDLGRVTYIKGYGEYLKIYLDGVSSPIMTLSSFVSMLSRLPANFIQVHRSYVVNMNAVREIVRARIVIDDETYIPVGDSYRQSLMSYLQVNAIGTSGRKD